MKRSALHMAILENHAEICRILVTFGANIDLSDYQQKTPLHLASIQGSSEIISLLLEYGAIASKQDFSGAIPLHYACTTNTSSVNYLLSSKECLSCINHQDKHGFTPLIVATLYGQVDIMELLLNFGADVNLKDLKGKSALHYSVIRGLKKPCEILIAHGANVEARDNDGIFTNVLELNNLVFKIQFFFFN